MKSFFHPVGISVLSLVLLGAGCSSAPSDDFFTSCDTTTSHDSCVTDGADEALIGTWHLVSQTLSTSSGTIVNPFAGRTTVFEIGTITLIDDAGNESDVIDLQYSENYSTEETDDVSVGGITSSCDVSGLLGGTWSVESNIDLDAYDEESDEAPPSINELHIWYDGGSPSVICDAGGTSITSNNATTPLGVGVTTGDPPYVAYTYSMDESWSNLSIVLDMDSGITSTFLFQK
jgi:hypothetical protein